MNVNRNISVFTRTWYSLADISQKFDSKRKQVKCDNTWLSEVLIEVFRSHFEDLESAAHLRVPAAIPQLVYALVHPVLVSAGVVFDNHF